MAHWRKKTWGIAASWLAAYALVLNVILSSALLATMPPAAAEGHALCFGSAESSDASNTADRSGKPAGIHCPICIGSHVASAPPPLAPALLERLALVTSPGLVLQPQSVVNAPCFDHQARGPPARV